MLYFDNAATTPTSSNAIETVQQVLKQNYANPSGLYKQGYQSEKVLTNARLQLAKAMGAKEQNIIFTASGSEANNIAIFGAVAPRKAWGTHVVITGYEHPSCQNAVNSLKENGYEISVIYPDKNGIVSEDEIIGAVTKQTALVCAMHVNNETGAVLDVCKIAKEVKLKNSRCAVHIDGVQAFCKLQLNLESTDIDTYAVSGHKINAPKGIGALYIRKGFNIGKFLYGGGQENGIRPGTENIAFAAAFGQCATEHTANFNSTCTHIKALKVALLDKLSKLPYININSPTSAIDGIINFSVENIKSETMLHFLDNNYNICVSSGSACSKGAPSHTLTSMGLNNSLIDTAIRVSFSAENTLQDIDILANAIDDGFKKIAKIKR